MDALVCVGPGELLVERRPDPVRGDGEVLVRPLQVGICGTDYHIYEGKHPFLQYPRVMGHELAVEVLEAFPGAPVSAGEVCVVNPYLSCGRCVTCRAGKENCCVRIEVLGVHRDGGMATLLSISAANLIRAEGLTPEQCATVEFLAIGAHAVRRAQFALGERVLVVGAGPIGLGVAAFAGLSEAQVSLLDLDAGRLEAARLVVPGASTVLGGSDAEQLVAEATGGEGYSVVFDATGNAASMERGFDFVAPGGRYVLVSVVKDPVSFNDPDFHRKEMSLLGSRNATSLDFERVIDAIRRGHVDDRKLLTHRTSLAKAVRDIPLWATEKRGLIKAMIAV